MLSQQSRLSQESPYYEFPYSKRSLLNHYEGGQQNSREHSAQQKSIACLQSISEGIPSALNLNSIKSDGNFGKLLHQETLLQEYQDIFNSSDDDSSSDDSVTSIIQQRQNHLEELNEEEKESRYEIEVRKIIQQNVKFGRREQDKYFTKIMNLYNQQMSADQNRGTKNSIQKTIVQVLEKLHQNYQEESDENCEYESIENNKPNKMPDAEECRSSIVFSRYRNKRKSYIDLFNIFVREFHQEMEKQSIEASPATPPIESNMSLDQLSQCSISMKLKLKYHQLKRKHLPTDNYNLILESNLNRNWLIKEYYQYHDKRHLLTLRKLFVYYTYLFSLLCQRLVESKFFIFLVSGSIIYNMFVFVLKKDMNHNIIVLCLFSTEIFVKLCAGITIFRDTQNLLDILILASYIINIVDPEVIKVEFTPLRLIRILFFLGMWSERLNIMILSLQQSLQFLSEAMILMLIFTTFFALCGLHLFQGLFRLRCYHSETGILVQQMCGYDYSCAIDQYCAYSFNNPQIPTSFDNFMYAYAQILRVMIYNDWTDPLYYSMRTFHFSIVIFYLLIIFVAGIFCGNLIVAVLKTYYSETVKLNPKPQQIVKEVIPLNILKHIKLLEQIKLIQLEMIWQSEFRQSIHAFQTDELDNLAKSSKVRRLRQIKKSPQTEIKDKMLSARQKKEVQTQDNLLLTQQDNPLTYPTDEGIEESPQEFLLKNWFLPNKYLEQQTSKILENNKTHLPKLAYINLKRFPILSWEIVVQYSEYQSTSTSDIFTMNSKEQLKKFRRQREEDFFRKCAPKHYYLLKEDEVQKLIKAKVQKLRKQRTVNLPLKKKISSISKSEPKQPNSNRHLYYGSQRQSPSRKTIDFNKNQTQQTIITDYRNCFFLNGSIYTKEEFEAIINRECPYEDKIHLFDEEEKYYQFRLDECRQMIIVKYNDSAEDVYNFFDINKKVPIYKALNSANMMIFIRGFIGIVKVLEHRLLIIMRLRLTEQIFDFFVLLNIVFLCAESFLNSTEIILTNNILTVIVLLEQILKCISMGLRKYSQKTSHIIDAICIIGCMIEITVDAIVGVNQNNNLFLKLLRALQALLFYRIIKYNRFAVQIGLIITQTINSFLNLIILMMFAISVFALIGMNLFQGSFPQNSETGLLHSFDDFPQAFMAVFDRSTSDDWYGLVIMGSTYTYPIQTILYCTFLLYFVNFMTFGLVLAIILDGFSTHSLQYEEQVEMVMQQVNSEVSDEVKDKVKYKLDRKMTLKSAPMGKQDSIVSEKEKVELNKYSNEDSVESFDLGLELCDYSLWLLSRRNRLRKICYKLSVSSIFIWCENLVILASILNLAFKMYIVEIVLNQILLLCCVIRIIAYGIFTKKGGLISDLWRSIDFLYLVAYLIQLIWNQQQTKFLVIFTYLKYVRPLRLLNSFPQMQETNEAFARSLPDLINIFIVQLMVWFIFAIFGTIIYQDQFGYCASPLNFNVNKQQCVSEGKEWMVYVHNFDDILQAISTLYVICTGDSWGMIFQISYNSDFSWNGPSLLNNRWITYVYYFSFVMIGSLFFMGFFSGILFINFQTYRKQLINQHLTEDQILFLQISDVILKEQSQYSSPPQSRVRVLSSKLIHNPTYKKLMGPFIILEAFTLASVYFEASISYLNILNNIYYFVSCIMIIDTALKLFAYGLVRYFGYIWRKLELFLSILSIVDFIMNNTNNWVYRYYHSTIRDDYFLLYRFFYILRNLRILLFIQEFKGLSRLVRVLYFTLPVLAKILLIFVLILTVYALIGTELFGTITKGVIMDDYLNFTTFPKSLLTLFKCSTQNGWRLIMTDCTSLNPYCKTDPTQCGQSWVIVIIYFYSCTLILGFIVINLFVLALVEQFEKFYNSQDNVIQTYIENIDHFQTVWSKYSQETQGKKVHTRNLARFLLELGPPLGSQEGNLWDAAYDAFKFRLIADNNGFVFFNEVLYETVRFNYKQSILKGSKEGISKMKMHDRQVRFKLNNINKKASFRRQSFDPQIQLKGNFNLLQDFLFLLMAFRTWVAYHQKLIDKAKRSEFTESQLSIEEELPQSKSSRISKSSRSHYSLGDLKVKYTQVDSDLKQKIIFIPEQQNSAGIKLLSPSGQRVIESQFAQSVNESLLFSRNKERLI